MILICESYASYLFEKVKYNDGNINNPIPSTVDILYHATGFSSSLWVTKNNKIRTSRNHGQKDVISVATDIKYYPKTKAIVGNPGILWELDYKLMKDSGIKFQLNTSYLKTVDGYEALIREKEVKNFNRYVINTTLIEEEIKRAYDYFVRDVELYKEDKNRFSSSTTIQGLYQKWGMTSFPKTFEVFKKRYVAIIEERFGKVSMVKSDKDLR